MKITCDTHMDGWLETPPPGQQKVTYCGRPAVIVILSSCTPVLCRGTLNGVHRTESVDLTISYGACEVHAAGEVHEAKQSMADDEYVIVNLTAEARLESVRKYVVDSEPGIMRQDRADILAIINGDVPAPEVEGGCGS